MNLEDLKIENEKLKSENQSLKNEIQELKNKTSLLIEKGADVNHQNKDRRTALMAACLNGNYEIDQILIEKDVDINHQDNNEWAANVENKYLDEEIYYLEEICSHGDPPKTIMRSTKNKEQLRILLGNSEMNYTYGTHIIAHGTKKEMNEKYPQYFND